MNNRDFKVGDIVRVKDSYDLRKFRGLKGVIAKVPLDNSQLGVYFKDIDFETHTCSGAVPECKGWWLFASELEIVKPAKPVKLVIFMQDKKTVAKLFNPDSSTVIAQAKCSPDDNFNFLTGAQIALQRLVKKTKNKYVIPKDLLVNVNIE